MSYRLRNILIAIALAAVAALLVTYYVTNDRRSRASSEASVNVYVASKDIPVGTPGSEVVSGGYLEVTEVARKSVVPGALQNPSEIEGDVANETIFVGEQVTARRFTAVETQGVVAKLTGTQRGFQLPGDEHQLLVGTLKDGDRVDVVANIKFRVDQVEADEQGEVTRSSSNIERTASRVVLRDILVIRAEEKPPEDTGIADVAADHLSVTLQVTDSQVQKLFFVMKNGDWHLELRPQEEPADSPESVETVESVLGDGLKPAQLEQLLNGFAVQAPNQQTEETEEK